MFQTGWGALADSPSVLEVGDVVHVRSRGFFSRMIARFSRARGEELTWATHSALVIGTGGEIIEALNLVKRRSILAYRGRRSQLLVTRKPGGISVSQKQGVASKALEYQGRSYGYLKIAAHVLDRLFNNRYLFRRLAHMHEYPICSWLVAFVYDRVLCYWFSLPPNAAQPDDLLDHCVRAGWSFVWADSTETWSEFRSVYGIWPV